MAGAAKKTRVNTVPECKPRRREVRVTAAPRGSRQEPLISGGRSRARKMQWKGRGEKARVKTEGARTNVDHERSPPPETSLAGFPRPPKSTFSVWGYTVVIDTSAVLHARTICVR